MKFIQFTILLTISLSWKDLHIDGGATIATADINGGTWLGTIDGAWTAAGQTCANLGTVTTADINGGNIDDTAIGVTGRSTAAPSLPSTPTALLISTAGP